MDPGTFMFWQTALGHPDNLDRVILRDVLTKLNVMPDVIEESSQTYLLVEILTNAIGVLSDKGCSWLNRAFEYTSWNGTQFVSVPVYLDDVKKYLKNV